MTTACITAVHPLPMDDYLELVSPDVVRVKGHRIGLEHIVERYRDGYSPDQIALDFPGVSLAQIYGIIAYYLHHQDEVDAYVQRVDDRAEEAYQRSAAEPPSPATTRIRELKMRRMREKR